MPQQEEDARCGKGETEPLEAGKRLLQFPRRTVEGGYS